MMLGKKKQRCPKEGIDLSQKKGAVDKLKTRMMNFAVLEISPLYASTRKFMKVA